MALSSQISKIKTDIDSIVGCKVRLKANKGRKKTFVREGILEETYPNLFIILLTDDEPSRRISFTYTDILTNTVKLDIIEEEDKKIANG